MCDDCRDFGARRFGGAAAATRASGRRDLGCLAVLIVGTALAFQVVGLAHPPPPPRLQGNLLYAAESALSLVSRTVELTGWGRTPRTGDGSLGYCCWA
jgi:hypothetical protein